VMWLGDVIAKSSRPRTAEIPSSTGAMDRFRLIFHAIYVLSAVSQAIDVNRTIVKNMRS